MSETDRKYCLITPEQMNEIRCIALKELETFLKETAGGKYASYADNIIAICLCQGFAQHCIETQICDSIIDNEVFVSAAKIAKKGYKILPDGTVLNGIKDIDIWIFFYDNPELPIPNFKNMNNKPVYAEINGLGEVKIDCMKKGIKISLSDNEIVSESDMIRKYLSDAATSAAWHLKKKSVIGIYPNHIYRKTIWKSKRFQEQ